LIDAPKENLRRQVAALFAAKRTLHNDGLERELGNAGRDIPAALLAGHNESFPR
jgi:hypothetical protein